MEFLIITLTCFALFFLSLIIIERIENANYQRNFMEWKKVSTMIKYRIHITCNGVIMARTFEGDNYSDVLNKAIDYSIKEESGFPDVIILTKDVIYL